jgi:hypothetical protein
MSPGRPTFVMASWSVAARQDGELARLEGREVLAEIKVPGGCGQEITAVKKTRQINMNCRLPLKNPRLRDDRAALVDQENKPAISPNNHVLGRYKDRVRPLADLPQWLDREDMSHRWIVEINTVR